MNERTMRKPLISVITPCYNEEENVREVCEQVKGVFSEIPGVDYEHLFIDNSSKDGTVRILKEIASKDSHVRIIVNARNFGVVRSPYYAILQSQGDAVIVLMSDLQDPPHLIKEFVKKWEEGYKIAMAVKAGSGESPVMFSIRKLYYYLVSKISNVELVSNFSGYALYDREVVELLRAFDDPYPDLRSQLGEMGFERAVIPYIQPARKRGVTKNGFYSLYDQAMLGLTNHSKVPLRFATMIGFCLSFLNLVVGFGYLIYKLLFWNSFSVGIAPVVIGLFFFASVQMLFIGIIGEYIGFIHTQILKRPLVIEKERINFTPEEKK